VNRQWESFDFEFGNCAILDEGIWMNSMVNEAAVVKLMIICRITTPAPYQTSVQCRHLPAITDECENGPGR
jgi:hypothetical protein